jgi:hypothetical protein
MVAKHLVKRSAADAAPSSHASAVTPHDTNDLPFISRALFVGGAGNVAVEMGSGDNVTFTGVPAGFILPIEVSKVLSTGTTATNIVALY